MSPAQPEETKIDRLWELMASKNRLGPGQVLAAFAKGARVAFDPVPPVGRQLKGPVPSAAHEAVRALVAVLATPADEYPFPFYRVP